MSETQGACAHTGAVNRLEEIGIRMALLVRRKHAANEEWTQADREFQELEEELRTAGSGKLYGSERAARLPDTDRTSETQPIPPAHALNPSDTQVIYPRTHETAIIQRVTNVTSHDGTGLPFHAFSS